MQSFDLGNVTLQSGQILGNAWLSYEIAGKLNDNGDNVVVLPTFYTGTHVRNRALYGPGRAIDPVRHFIVSVNLFGNGQSTSPSNAWPDTAAHRFPEITLFDNVYCQHQLLTKQFNIEKISLVAGWSMAGCQAFQWAAQYPEMVEAIVPYCAAAKTSPHNIVFLEGIRAALTTDQHFDGGRYRTSPVAGLKAFARVYAGWAYSQTFFREALFREIGFETLEALLIGWEQDHLQWDANDLLAMLWSWQHGDISRQAQYQGDVDAALGAITARAVLIPCSQDLYFPPEDSALEVARMPNAELRVFESSWGHCVGSPGQHEGFQAFLDTAIREVMG